MEMTNKEKVVALITSLETGDKTAIGYINPEKYIQHNLMAGDGLQGFGELLHKLPHGSVKAKVVRAFSDGDYVFTQTDYDFFGPKAGFDVFRFENGKIVEHWDNLAEKAKTPNPSGHTQFDGETEITDLDMTHTNKQIAGDFLKTVLIGGQFDKLAHYIDGEKYIQHNPNIGDGISGLIKAVEAMAKQGIHMVLIKIRMVFGEGNFVLTVSEGTFAGKPVAYYDLFRLKNNKIVEHWDVIEEIPPAEKWANKNGKF